MYMLCIAGRLITARDDCLFVVLVVTNMIQVGRTVNLDNVTADHHGNNIRTCLRKSPGAIIESSQLDYSSLEKSLATFLDFCGRSALSPGILNDDTSDLKITLLQETHAQTFASRQLFTFLKSD